MDVKDYLLKYSAGNIYWKDLQGRYLGCNANFCKVAQISSAEDIIGKSDMDLFGPSLTPEKVKKIMAIDRDVMENGKVIITEELGVDETGQMAYYLTQKIPIFENGIVIGLVGTSINIDEKKQAEKNLKALGASIAHELRTPLCTLYLGLERILDYTNKSIDEIQDNVKYLKKLQNIPTKLIEIINNCQKIIDIQLANIASDEIDNEKVEVCNIRKSIEKAIDVYPYVNNQRALVNVDFSRCEDFSFLGNEQKMVLVFWNLIKNALYYIDAAGKGEITITLDTLPDFNVCSFKDTGSGMTKATAKNVFKQFFTQRVNGTGLGLSFCDLVMKKCGGKIVCHAEKGEFAEFKLLFPK